MTPRPIELDVRGRPVPQGSMTAFAVQNKTTGKFRGVVSQGGSKERRQALAEWRSAVRDSVFAALGVRELEAPHFAETPLAVEITFRLARPASHYGSGKNAGKLKSSAPPFPMGTPDVDKLARAVLDALKGTAFDDDSRVVDLHPTKVYSSVEGATIRIRPCTAIEERFVLADATGVELGYSRDPNARDESTPATPELDAPPPPRPRKSQQERIREIIGGSQIDAELRTMGKSRDSHVFEKHAGRIRDAVQKIGDAAAKAIAPYLPPPQIKIDESAAAALRAGENEYRARVLGQAPIPYVPAGDGPISMRVLREIDTRPCDGEHALPRCNDPECWRDDASFAVLKELVERDPFLRAAVADRVAAVEDLDSVIARGDRGELARRLLSAPAGSAEERRCIDALAPPAEDDFG